MSQPDVPQRKQTAIRTDDPYFTDTVSRKRNGVFFLLSFITITIQQVTTSKKNKIKIIYTYKIKQY